MKFEPCWVGSGTRGFFGEGYWYHKLPFFRWWLKWVGSTFVAKTVTADKTEGNMPLQGAKKLFQPKEWFPRCIWFSIRRAITLNSVGLSNPGGQVLLDNGLAESQDEPFQISFMAIKKTKAERLDEARRFRNMLVEKAFALRARDRLKFGLQINMSCPNTGHDPAELMGEALELLDIFAEMRIQFQMPVIVKLNLLAPLEMIEAIAAHEACDCICITNTIPLSEARKLFPLPRALRKVSPLELRDQKFGAGGISSPAMLTELAAKIIGMREHGIEIPVNAGGGIRKTDDVDFLVRIAGLRRGVDSVSIASAAMVRPRQVIGIIRRANELLG